MGNTSAPAPPLKAAPPVSTAPKPFIGGRSWRADQVFWGAVGPKGEAEMLGYLAKFDGAGRPTDAAVNERACDVWNVTAVYSLNSGADTIYVGEGKLGDRLKKHAEVDVFAGRWDTFSWLAPGHYEFDAAQKKATVKPPAAAMSWTPAAKEFVEFLELVAIQFGMPLANRQLPDKLDVVGWLTQRRSAKLPPTADERLEAVHAMLVELKGKIK